jgi:hypothetical protein
MLTEQMLRRSALVALNPVASAHHEKCDGSGYHKRVRAEAGDAGSAGSRGTRCGCAGAGATSGWAFGAGGGCAAPGGKGIDDAGDCRPAVYFAEHGGPPYSAHLQLDVSTRAATALWVMQNAVVQ